MDKQQRITYIFRENAKIIYSSSEETFYKKYPPCESCLVKIMCLIVDFGDPGWLLGNPMEARVIVKRPCEEFKMILKGVEHG